MKDDPKLDEVLRDVAEGIAAAVGDGISIQGKDFRILYQNRIHKAITGDHVGRYCYNSYRITGRVCDDCPVELTFGDGRSHKVERTRSTPEGVCHYEIMSSPLKDSEGRMLAAVEVVRDITERKKYEENLLKTEKLESLAVLAGGIAHDFNNFLVGILGNIALAKLGTAPGDRIHERLSEAEKACIAAKGLTQQLLTFSRSGEPAKEAVAVGEIIRGSCALCLSGSNTRCLQESPADLWTIEGDASQIAQVINNLIINADQAMPYGGMITLGCENVVLGDETVLPVQPGKFVRITISDEGVGIPRKYLPKIFDPYFTTKQKGSGLGLATSYSIIKKHGGHIDVRSEAGKGTTFHIYLPASGTGAAARVKVSKELPAGSGRILLMDDEEIVRIAAMNMLGQIGYEAEYATDGEEAVAAYGRAMSEGRRFDAVILDLTVRGGMGGKETLTKLREIDPGLRAIAFSGYSDDTMVSDYRASGFSGFLPKPCELEEMAEALRSVLGKKKHGKQRS